MRNGWKKAAAALGFAGAMALALPNASFAAPASGGMAVNAAAEGLPVGTTEVRWRGGGGAVVGGLAAGIIGAAAANAWGPRYGYGYGYGYGAPYYGSYGYGPYYGAPYAYYGGPRYYGGGRYYARPHWRGRAWSHRGGHYGRRAHR